MHVHYRASCGSSHHCGHNRYRPSTVRRLEFRCIDAHETTHRYPDRVKPILKESSSDPSDLFDPWAGAPVTSWSELTQRIDDILTVHGSATDALVWRGVSDARWGLFSSLYRRLKMTKSTVEERDMLAEEHLIITRARREWRLDQMSSLEILAHIQHYGGPTRLLDVTSNPLIASWFAVEEMWSTDGEPQREVDSRVFCFYVGEWIGLQGDWAGQELPWRDWQTTQAKVQNGWGTGLTRRVWRPPAYNSRISAQNGAFLIDGVPFGYSGSNTFYKKPGSGGDRWRIGEVRDASSIPIKLNDATRAKQLDSSSPAFSFKIAKAARKEIRARLEQNYGYSAASLYSDLFGLAQYADQRLPK